ncbi:hypothetical protein ACFLSJ_09035, partial [Verrucomicrobiota bacterium]
MPQEGLGVFGSFTLTDGISSDCTTIPVAESTAEMSTIIGFTVKNSVTLWIDDELIVFKDFRKEPPYAFAECERGAYGTRAASHAGGAPVRHLKEYYGCFAPDADTDLFTEVAARMAATFNECGFDMIYFDASDAIWLVCDRDETWYYWSKFAAEVWRRLDRPAQLEHYPWVTLSRAGAQDHPVRGYKRFIDRHSLSNSGNRLRFIPQHLGWWATHYWLGAQGERTFPDDMEYLGAKCVAHDCGFSLMNIGPESLDEPGFAAIARVVKRYETLRRENSVPDTVKARLAEPGAEFTVTPSPDGRDRLQPIQYERHKVSGLDDGAARWITVNRFDRQPAGLRIEALFSV